MVQKIVEARKRSEDPKQEAVREQKAEWNAQVSQFIAKLIAFKKGINGRGEPKAGLPPSNIREPLPSEISLYLRHLATEYAEIVQNADGIIKSQYQYSMTRRKSTKHANEIGAPIISQASWWGSRLWSRMKLHSLPKEVRKLRLEMIRSASYMYDELDDIEDKFYSTDIIKNASGINQLAILSVGSLRSFLRIYNKLLYTYTKLDKPSQTDQSTEGLASEQRVINEKPTQEERAEEEGMALPKPQNPQKILAKRIEQVTYIKRQLFDAEMVLNFIRKNIDKLGFDPKLVDEISRSHQLLHTQAQNFILASRKVGANEVLKLEEWAKDIIRKYKKEFTSVYDLLKEKMDLSQVTERDNFHIMLPLIGIEGIDIAQPPSPMDLGKQASGVVSRWINRKLLRMSQSAENDIKLAVTEKLIKVIHGFDKVMDIVENKDSTSDKIRDSVLSVINDYSLMLINLQILAKIIYLKQDEVKFTEKQPILKVKSSIVRDLQTIIDELQIYTDMVIV
jgi:hypothetical protein